MQEQLISLETAKLAKEKGFNEPCFNYYFEDGEFRENIYTGTTGYYGGEFSFEFENLLENWNNKFLTKKMEEDVLVVINQEVILKLFQFQYNPNFKHG